jgi:hypothetical protein
VAWLLALLAFAAMLGQDLLSTWLVQAEADYRALRAGLLDTLNWPMGIAVTYVTVEALAGHDMALKVVVCAAVSVANFGGTSTAVRIGRRLRRQGPAPCCPHCTGGAR